MLASVGTRTKAAKTRAKRRIIRRVCLDSFAELIVIVLLCGAALRSQRLKPLLVVFPQFLIVRGRKRHKSEQRCCFDPLRCRETRDEEIQFVLCDFLAEESINTCFIGNNFALEKKRRIELNLVIYGSLVAAGLIRKEPRWISIGGETGFFTAPRWHFL